MVHLTELLCKSKLESIIAFIILHSIWLNSLLIVCTNMSRNYKVRGRMCVNPSIRRPSGELTRQKYLALKNVRLMSLAVTISMELLTIDGVAEYN